MAVGWIKFRKSLKTDGRVRIVARKCGCTRGAVIGGLFDLWVAADDHANDDGVLIGYVAEDINEETEIDGFCEALPEEWIDLSGEYIRLPDYLEHNGDTAKKRIDSARRKTKQREVSHNSVTNVTRPCDKSVTRVDKSREDKIRSEKKKDPPKPPKGAEVVFPPNLDVPEFHEAWAEWEQHRREIKKTLKPTTVRKQFKQLSEMGPQRSVTALNHSMTNGWSGIFEPSSRGDPQKNSRGADMNAYEDFIAEGNTSGTE